MRLTIFEKNDVVLLLSDHSLNADKVCEQLEKEKTFSEISYIKTKGLVSSRNNRQKINDFFDVVLGTENRYSFYLSNIANICFDELICYNYNIDIIGLFSLLYKKNDKVKVSLYEEGILSYDVKFEDNIHRDFIRIARKILRKKDISDAFSHFYCFYPELYKGSLKVISVPVISTDSKCVDILRNIFSVDKSQMKYTQKYIYFSSVYDFEGGASIGEYELVKRIIDVVGKDNLMVKMHPRDARDIYEKNGFIVDRNSSIPWEVIQLSEDFSDKVFMTATSGSVLAGSFMTDNPVTTFYMYKMCDISGNNSAKKTTEFIYNYLQENNVKGVLENVKIIDSLDEIIK